MERLDDAFGRPHYASKTIDDRPLSYDTQLHDSVTKLVEKAITQIKEVLDVLKIVMTFQTQEIEVQ